MKKVIVGLLLVLFIISLASCGGGKVKFDPDNREHLLELYATTNYGTDDQKYAAIEKYDLNNAEVMKKYGEGITKLYQTDDWTKFLDDAEKYYK
ncbi:hypothetical protein KAU33_14335 [Candidatus Dependentiae bacterium]|nr:hypothetical protein [Candidatus Dependentiae bacterium]